MNLKNKLIIILLICMCIPIASAYITTPYLNYTFGTTGTKVISVTGTNSTSGLTSNSTYWNVVVNALPNSTNKIGYGGNEWTDSNSNFTHITKDNGRDGYLTVGNFFESCTESSLIAWTSSWACSNGVLVPGSQITRTTTRQNITNYSNITLFTEVNESALNIWNMNIRHSSLRNSSYPAYYLSRNSTNTNIRFERYQYTNIWLPVANTTSARSANTLYYYAFDIQGPNLYGYVSTSSVGLGSPILSYTDTSNLWPSGDYFTLSGTNVSFDNIRVINSGQYNGTLLIHSDGVGNENTTSSININISTPAGTNYTVQWRQKNTGAYSSPETKTNNSVYTLTGNSFENTDILITLNGNSTTGLFPLVESVEPIISAVSEAPCADCTFSGVYTVKHIGGNATWSQFSLSNVSVMHGDDTLFAGRFGDNIENNATVLVSSYNFLNVSQVQAIGTYSLKSGVQKASEYNYQANLSSALADHTVIVKVYDTGNNTNNSWVVAIVNTNATYDFGVDYSSSTTCSTNTNKYFCYKETTSNRGVSSVFRQASAGWITVRIVSNTTGIHGYVNDVLIHSFTEANATGSRGYKVKIGNYWSDASEIYFDDIQVYEQLNGTASIWFDSLSGNKTTKLSTIDAVVPTNTNITLGYGDNGSSMFTISTVTSSGSNENTLVTTYEDTGAILTLNRNASTSLSLSELDFTWESSGGAGSIGNVHFDLNFSDIDGDTALFGTNATCFTNCTFDTSTGVFDWNVTTDDIGTYNWNFNVSDGYGSTNQTNLTIIVSDRALPGTPANLTANYGGGEFWYTWQSNSSGSASDVYNYSVNGQEYNLASNNWFTASITPHQWFNISGLIGINTSGTFVMSSPALNYEYQIPNMAVTEINGINDDYQIYEGNTLYIDVSAVDEDSDNLTYTILPSNWSIVKTANTTANISLTTGENWQGNQTYTLTVSDSYGSTMEKGFNIEILDSTPAIYDTQYSITSYSEEPPASYLIRTIINATNADYYELVVNDTENVISTEDTIEYSVEDETNYSLDIRIYNSNLSVYSAWQNNTWVNVSEAPWEILNLTNETVTSNTVNLTWNASLEYDFSTYEGFKDGVHEFYATTNHYNVTGLSGSTDYNFSVRANDTHNNWGYNSTDLMVTTLEAGAIPAIIFDGDVPIDNGTINSSSISINTTVQNIVGGTAFMSWNNSLIAWYKLDEQVGSNVEDYSVNGNNGSWNVSGNASINSSSGKFGTGVSFDGLNDFILIPNINIGKVHSISMWIKYEDSGDGMIIGKYGGGGDNNGYVLYIDSTNLYYNSGGSDFVTVPHSGLSSNVFYQLTIIRNNTQIKFYKNESLIDTKTILNNNDMVVSSIGKYSNETPGYPAQMILDDVKIFNRVISNDEINASFNASNYKLSFVINNLSNHAVYNYSALLQDSEGIIYSTETRNINILLSTYMPPSPVNLSYSNGSTWINHTWLSGNGNITDSYNILHNGIWYNQTNVSYYNHTYSYLEYSNISIFAYNNTNEGLMNVTPISSSVQNMVELFPSISFIPSTPENNTELNSSFIPVNTSVENYIGNGSVFIDFGGSLLYWMKLEDLNDSSSYSNNGTFYGDINYSSVDGILGNAIEFNGSEYIEINDSFLNGLISGTMSVWFKTNYSGNGNSSSIVSIPHNSLAGLNGWDISTKPDGSGLRSSLNVGAGLVTVTLDSFNYSNGQWHNAISVFTPTEFTFYVDGAAVYTSYISSPLVSSSNELNIGRFGEYGNYFNGSIDNVQIWNRDFSLNEVKSLYNFSSVQLSKNMTINRGEAYNFTAYLDIDNTIYSVSRYNVSTSPDIWTTYMPNAITSLNYQVGTNYVNYSWSPSGLGNVTNSYNISLINNSVQYYINGSNQSYINSTIGYLNWSNISVYTFNNTNGGSLNTSAVSANNQVGVNDPCLVEVGEFIQVAINDTTCSVVTLGVGTHVISDFIIARDNLTLIGNSSSRNDTIIDGNGITIFGIESNYISNFTLKNLTINDDSDYNLNIRYTDNITIDNIWVKGHLFIGKEGSSAWVDDIIIKNSEFNKQALTKNMRGGLFENNTFRNSPAEICLENQENSEDVVIRSNIFSGCQYGLGLYSGGDNFTVIDNLIYGNGLAGIRWLGISNSIIRNNSIYENGNDAWSGGVFDAGILIFGPSYGQSGSITHNRIYNNGGYGILFDTVSTNPVWVGDITNNDIYGNDLSGISLPSEAIGSTAIIKNNIISNNTEYGIYYIAGNVTPSYNDVWGNSLGNYYNISGGIGNISENPLYVLAGTDFHLQVGSPAIGAGLDGVDMGSYSSEAIFNTSIPLISSVHNYTVGDTWGIVNATINQSDALSHVEYGVTDSLGSTTTNNTNRSVNLTSLNNNTKYYYMWFAYNSSDTSKWSNSSLYNFTTNNNYTEPVMTTPLISDVSNYTVGDTFGIVNATINQSNAISHVEYGLTVSLGSKSTNNTDRSVNLTELNNNTLYYYMWVAYNASDYSKWSNSSIYNFTTNNNYSEPPIVNTIPLLSDISLDIDVYWSNISYTVNQSNAETNICYGLTVGYGACTGVLNSGTSRYGNISGLSNNTTYYYSISAVNISQTNLISFYNSSFTTDEVPLYRLNGTVVPLGSTISVTGKSNITGGDYDYGSVFIGNASVWINVSKSLYYPNNTLVTFANANMTHNVTLELIPVPGVISWENNKTSNDTLVLYTEMNEIVEFNATFNQTLTGCAWSGATEINCSGVLTYAYKNFTSSGVNLVSIIGINANGSSSSLQWTVNVNDTYPIPAYIFPESSESDIFLTKENYVYRVNSSSNQIIYKLVILGKVVSPVMVGANSIFYNTKNTMYQNNRTTGAFEHKYLIGKGINIYSSMTQNVTRVII